MNTLSIPPNTLSIQPNTLYDPPNTITLHSANKEVLRITHDGRLVTGEGLSAEEATQQAAKLLIASFEEQIQKMVETRIAAEREKVRVLRDALENLCDEQNGAPLCTREAEWKEAMDKADATLAATKEDSP